MVSPMANVKTRVNEKKDYIKGKLTSMQQEMKERDLTAVDFLKQKQYDPVKSFIKGVPVKNIKVTPKVESNGTIVNRTLLGDEDGFKN